MDYDSDVSSVRVVRNEAIDLTGITSISARFDGGPELVDLKIECHSGYEKNSERLKDQLMGSGNGITRYGSRI